MITLKIPQMNCGHCIRTIGDAVKSIDPDAHIEADLLAHTVVVRSKAQEATLRHAIAAAGYENERLAA